MKNQNRFDQIVTVLGIVALIAGCGVVLRPFLSAVVWAAIICFSTWPIYSRLEKWLYGKRTLAATCMTLIIALVIVIPFVFFGMKLVHSVTHFVPMMKIRIQQGVPALPEWIGKIPIVGERILNYWANFMQDSDHMTLVLKNFLTEWKGWFLARSLDFGQIVVQLVLSVFISFFIYRDGMTMVEKLTSAEKRIAGPRARRLLDVIGGTIKGVLYGILGTAAAQGILAAIGLAIVHIPFALGLGLVTFFLSLLPIGPPLVWGGAALWLFYQGSTWRMIFMLVWGFCIVSGVDNVLKPYLISRGSNLPFILVFLGVFGGVIAFGVIGVFVGPTLIAVGYVLLQEWSSLKVEEQNE
jgi:predicted PurR-regulated permease PerM